MSVAARPGAPAAPAPRVVQLRSSAGMHGAERMLLALATGLRGRGCPMRLLGIGNHLHAGQPLHDQALAEGVDAELLPCRGRIDLRTVALLEERLRQLDTDVLHVHDYKSACYGWLATRRRPVRLLATLHGWVDTTPALRLYNRLEATLLRRFDLLAVVSDAQVPRLLAAGVASARIRHVANGIVLPAPAPFPSPRWSDAPPGATTFAVVARLSPEKNVVAAVHAFATVAARDAAATLLIAGDGPDRGLLEAEVARLGLASRVRLLGNCDDMDALYARIDRLVLPSLSEGMPMVVLEAMARGIPIVATAVGDVPALLAQCSHGRLVPPGDAAALADAMYDALLEPAVHDAAAARHVARWHSADAMAGRYLAIYHALLGKADARQAA